MGDDPFYNSESLSKWTIQVLIQKGINNISKWRMLEYWMQVELYHTIEASSELPWNHFGDHEQPYYTEIPKPGSKHKVKWIDLVFAKPNCDTPEKIVWVELKDIGRSKHTLMANAYGIGVDLAALFTIDPRKTKEIWKDPPDHVIDRGRLAEWTRLSEGITKAHHVIAQIVLVPNFLLKNDGKDQIINKWIATFQMRTKHLKHDQSIEPYLDSSEKFTVMALVAEPFPIITQNHR